MMIQSEIAFLLLALALFASIVISGILTKRAVHQVIDRFCSYDALEAKKARKAEEIGLAPRDFLERMFRPRDYKPYALRLLKKAGIVRKTQEEKLYLVDEKLSDNMKCKRGG